jgi:hypothetical protein
LLRVLFFLKKPWSSVCIVLQGKGKKAKKAAAAAAAKAAAAASKRVLRGDFEVDVGFADVVEDVDVDVDVE